MMNDDAVERIAFKLERCKMTRESTGAKEETPMTNDDDFDRPVTRPARSSSKVTATVPHALRFTPAPPMPAEGGRPMRPPAERPQALGTICLHGAADPPPREPIVSADLQAILRESAAKAIIEGVWRIAAEAERLRNDGGAVIELILHHRKPEEMVAAVDYVGDFVDSLREALRFRRGAHR
jgi:hypothetical protein